MSDTGLTQRWMGTVKAKRWDLRKKQNWVTLSQCKHSVNISVQEDESPSSWSTPPTSLTSARIIGVFYFIALAEHQTKITPKLAPWLILPLLPCLFTLHSGIWFVTGEKWTKPQPPSCLEQQYFAASVASLWGFNSCFKLDLSRIV